jgi:anion-transporting  ArsA/GET3 family ATPase
MPKMWDLRSLLKKNLWIVTGKGGVGKTTMSAALGMLSAQSGLKTLLVETHGLTHLADLLEVGIAGYEPCQVQKNLYLIQITPEQAFEEYVLQQIKFKVVYNTVFNNRYVRHFIDAAPGLNELLTIGKIWSLVEKDSAPRTKKPFDLVIVDAPATGHGLSLLTVAQVVVDAVRVGPLKNKAEEILHLLQDPQKTLTWLVTLPEEMPVNEAVEMAEKLENEAGVSLGPLLMNSVWPELLTEDSLTKLLRSKIDPTMFQAYETRLDQSRFYVDKIKTQLNKLQCLELPLIYQTKTPRRIAERLSTQIQQVLTKD